MLLHTADHRYSSWSMRPWLLMKMAGIPFEVREHEFLDDIARQREQWRGFSPTSQVPVLQDGALCIWDSLAICLYIAERYPQAWPEDAAARAWAYAATAEMHSGFAVLRRDCPFRVTPASVVMHPDLMTDIRRINELWLQGLRNFSGDYLAGRDFGVVDAFYAPVVFRIRYYGLDDHVDSEVQRYIDRMMALPAVQEWVKNCQNQ